MPVTGHEQLALVLVGGRIRGGGLRRCRQTLEVELVRVPLPVDLRHDVLVVVIPEKTNALLRDATSSRERALLAGEPDCSATGIHLPFTVGKNVLGVERSTSDFSLFDNIQTRENYFHL